MEQEQDTHHPLPRDHRLGRAPFRRAPRHVV